MKESRTENSIINVFAAVSGQGIGIIVSFIARIVFVRLLGEDYLGVNSLFTNIVGLLALAELGVGTAINYSLYKPLAEKNIEKIKSLMLLYKKVYICIGAIILIIGLILTPFIQFFMKASDTHAIPNIKLIFFLFVINSAISYLYSYKRALIISDQYRYIATIYRYIFFCSMNVLQIVVLIVTRNYVLFLVIMLLATFFENYFVSQKADQMYPYLKEKQIKPLENDDISEIKKNTVALLFHKIGSSVVNSTDNILISKIIGIVTVGIYSNYLLITNALNIVIGQLFNSLVASIGNMGVSEKSEKAEHIFLSLFYINFLVVSVTSACLLSSGNLLIQAWFGETMVLSVVILIVIVFNFYLYQIRRSVLTFRDAYGLYWYDRYKALAEAILNLGISVILGIKLGLAGILMGTITSCLATSLWIEPYVLYKYAFKKSPKEYYIKLLIYSVVTFLDCMISYKIVEFFKFKGFIGFMFGCILTCVITLLIDVVLFIKTKEFEEFRRIFRKSFDIVFKKVRR